MSRRRTEVRAPTARIDERIHIPLGMLDDAELQALQRSFTYANPQHARLKGMGKRYIPKRIPPYLSSWRLSDGELTLPRGGLAKVRAVLPTLRTVDATTLGLPGLAGQIPDHRFEPRAYQVGLRDYCVEQQIALIRAPQGSGKTTTGYAIAAELKLPTLIVVPTEKIFLQWVRGCEAQLGMSPGDVGVIKGSDRRVRPLTVAMQQTLNNCVADYVDMFGVVIGDEAQRFAATTFFGVIDRLRARYRIGMSADERRADGQEFLVYDVFGPVGREVARQELIEAGNIIDAEIRVVPTEFRAPWYTRLRPQQRITAAARLAQEITEDAARNALAMEVLSWCVAENQPTIALTWRREHCSRLNALALQRGWNSGLLLGSKESEHEFTRTEREMRDGELRQAVGTYQAVGVGFDLPLVSRGIFVGPCASKTGKQQFAQFCGRFERPDPKSGKVNPDDAIIYYLWDRHVHGLNALRNIKRWKPKVSVLQDGEWVPVKDYLAAARSGHAEGNNEEDADGQLGFTPAR